MKAMMDNGMCAMAKKWNQLSKVGPWGGVHRQKNGDENACGQKNYFHQLPNMYHAILRSII